MTTARSSSRRPTPPTRFTSVRNILKLKTRCKPSRARGWIGPTIALASGPCKLLERRGGLRAGNAKQFEDGETTCRRMIGRLSISRTHIGARWRQPTWRLQHRLRPGRATRSCACSPTICHRYAGSPTATARSVGIIVTGMTIVAVHQKQCPDGDGSRPTTKRFCPT